jgi:hypothetical protein
MADVAQRGDAKMSTLPPGAILEAVIPHPSGEAVALYDVSHLLPTLRGRPQPARKPGAKIVRWYLHKSGGEGPDGWRGILAMVRYVTGQRKPPFPGAPYTLWAARNPERDADGRLVLYRLVADDRRSWHTGGDCNDHGCALVLQGDLSKRDLTPAQRIVADAALQYATGPRYPDMDQSDPVSTHSRSKRYGGTGKSVCPGEYAERWLDGWLRERAA